MGVFSASKGAPYALRIINHYVALFLARCANRRFMFSTAATALIIAKAVHIYAHLSVLILSELWTWGLSFFFQDTVVLLTLYLLFDKDLFEPVAWLASVAFGIGSTIAVVTVFVGACNISFFSIAGSEVHWRNVGILLDPASFDYLLVGLASNIVTLSAIIIVGWVIQDAAYGAAGMALDVIEWPLKKLWARFAPGQRARSKVGYTHLEQQEQELEVILEEEEEFDMGEKPAVPQDQNARGKLIRGCYLAIGLIPILQVVLLIARPADPFFTFVSWTLPLVPFVDFLHTPTTILDMSPEYKTGIGRKWDKRTALGEPIELTWLPRDETLPGFEDWYLQNTTHYRASKDPLKISNLDNPLHSNLKGALAGIDIRHVILVKLESTRRDAFPFKNESNFWKILASSYPDGKMPLDAQERLANLTPTANYITGDYQDGFEHANQPRRGGVNFKSAHTTSSFTLKSLSATLCGLFPLVADWNVEVENHFYQPCMPHIFNAFNKLDNTKKRKRGKPEFTQYPWKSLYMQTCTGGFDRQKLQMPMLGYSKSEVIDFQYLESAAAKHGAVTPDKGRQMVPEYELEPYLRDAFASARKNNERLFLTHLTSTTHGPFDLYEENLSETVHFSAPGGKRIASKYLNTVGYVDKWLARLLEMLDEEGVADETLVVFMGDHGLSVAESGGITPYYGWRDTSFRIPLVLSHPKLPAIDIDDAVVSMQVLPTILDMLRESGSLSDKASEAALDLMKNYEGQSLVRKLKDHSDETGQPNWQFTVTNPGRSVISVIDASHPERHLAIPVLEDIEWHFTADMNKDEAEREPVMHFSYRGLVHKVEKMHGVEMAKWVDSAAFAARWWMKEVHQRWGYKEKK